MTPKEICGAVVRSLDKHKAMKLRVLHVTELTSLTDYFVIAEGTGSTQVKALSDHVEYELGEAGVTPERIEGYHSSSWILLDYGCVVVHIFQQDARNYYDLDRLWKDGIAVDPATFIEDGKEEDGHAV